MARKGRLRWFREWSSWAILLIVFGFPTAGASLGTFFVSLIPSSPPPLLLVAVFVGLFAGFLGLALLLLGQRRTPRSSSIARQRAEGDIYGYFSVSDGRIRVAISKAGASLAKVTPTIDLNNASDVPIHYRVERMTVGVNGAWQPEATIPWVSDALTIPPRQVRSFSYHELDIDPLPVVLEIDLRYRIAYGQLGYDERYRLVGHVALTSTETPKEGTRANDMKYVGDQIDEPV